MNRIFLIVALTPVGIWLANAGVAAFLTLGMGCEVSFSNPAPCMVGGFDAIGIAQSTLAITVYGSAFIPMLVIGLMVLWLLIMTYKRVMKAD